MRLPATAATCCCGRPSSPMRSPATTRSIARSSAGPIRDFNAMFRRGRARGASPSFAARDSSMCADFRLAFAAAGAHACAITGSADPRSRPGTRWSSSGSRGGGRADRDPAARRRRASRSPCASNADEALRRRRADAGGWRRDVRIDIDAGGAIARVRPGAAAEPPNASRGPLVPGMPNLHSHAFQRAIAGRTGQREAPTATSFWTWRAAMYAFLERVDADAFEAIAAQAYVEMLKAGYTSRGRIPLRPSRSAGKAVRRSRRARAPRSSRRPRRRASRSRCCRCSTRMPVSAARRPRRPAPLRSLRSTSYSRARRALARDAARGGWTLGVAPHSLRAVTPEELAAIVALAPPRADPHSRRRAGAGSRRVRRLERRAADRLAARTRALDARWCVVHATHMTAEETRGLAASGAVAGLAPTTEADLGDGTFAARP